MHDSTCNCPKCRSGNELGFEVLEFPVTQETYEEFEAENPFERLSNNMRLSTTSSPSTSVSELESYFGTQREVGARQTIPLTLGIGGDPRIIDLTAKANKRLRLRIRDPKKVYALVLHQMACCYYVNDPLTRFLDNLAPHFAILPDGRILQLHPLQALTYASNGFNTGGVAVEFAGNFPTENGKWWIDRDEIAEIRKKLKKRKLPEAQIEARIQAYIKANQNQVTPAQIEAGRYLVRYLIRTMGLRVIVAHRQSSGTRDNDPGPDIWYYLGQWAIDTLGLSDGGPGFKTGTGKPIPNLWRTWDQAKPQP